MSLRINTNIAALNAHRNLVNSNNSLSKSMQRLSSGYRINQGADDPAGLVISEQFRAQIAGLNQAIENSEGSINMIQTAEGALTEINTLLTSMRELAIHAANEGFNDEDQLAADQAEITNALETIDRIAANTQFGTKKLLDGSKENVASIEGSNNSQATIVTSNLSTGNHYITATKSADPTAALNVSSSGMTLAGTGSDGDPYNLQEKVYDLNVVQASAAASKLSTANVDIVDDFGNGITFAGTATAAVMATMSLAASIDGAGTYTFQINYQENGGTPTGMTTLNVTVASGNEGADLVAAFNTALNGTDLEGKVKAYSTGGLQFTIKSENTGADYSIAWEDVTYSGAGTNQLDAINASDARGVSDNRLTIERLTATTGGSAVTSTDVTIGAGESLTMSSLVAKLQATLGGISDVAGTSADSDIVVTQNGDYGINIALRDQGSYYKFKLHSGTDATTGNARNVMNLSADSTYNVGQDGMVTLDGYSNSLNKVDYDGTQAYTLYSAADGESDRGSIAINVENAEGGLDVGSYLLDVTATKFNVTLDGGAAVEFTGGQFNTIYNADRSESLYLKYGLTSNGGTETISNIDQSLVFQIGANVGQTAQISLRNMSSTSLGNHITGNMFNNLSEIDVTTVQGAQDAQAIVDAAINEVSTTRGTLGSFQKNTLESNLRNLRVAEQNLTESESQIRDTDMAREMSEFSKNQILVQAGTSMLAQANQLPQIVLALF